MEQNVPLLGSPRDDEDEPIMMIMQMPSPNGRTILSVPVAVPVGSLSSSLATMQRHARLQQFQQALNAAVNALLSLYVATSQQMEKESGRAEK